MTKPSIKKSVEITKTINFASIVRHYYDDLQQRLP
jgi:hypothetical protein